MVERRTPRIKPITREEHREEQDDRGVAADRDPQPNDLGLPGGVAVRGDLGSCSNNRSNLFYS